MQQEDISVRFTERNMWRQEIRSKNDGKKIQDAHEAIRPTDISRTPAAIKESLTRDQFRLYQLIWKRFTASRMQPARYETTAVKIGAGRLLLYRCNFKM